MSAIPPEAGKDPGEWFQYAVEDLAIAESLLNVPRPFVRGALFHCQQAVEKLLKGFLLSHGRSFRRTHDLTPLGEECIEVDPTLQDAVRPSYALSEYASRARYPGDWQEPAVDEARSLMQAAQRVLAVISPRLVKN